MHPNVNPNLYDFLWKNTKDNLKNFRTVVVHIIMVNKVQNTTLTFIVETKKAPP